MARGRRSVNRPKETTFLLSLIVAAVGVLAYLNVLPVPELRAWAFWIVVLAFAILALGTRMRGV